MSAKNKEKQKTKETSYNEYVDEVDFFSYGILGAALGGMPRNCESKAEFNFVKAFFGFAIISTGIFLGTHVLATLGLLVYSVEGALVGLIAGTSTEAFVGSFMGIAIVMANEVRKFMELPYNPISNHSLKKLFYAAVGGGIGGFFLSEMEEIYKYLPHYNDSKNTQSSPNLRGAVKIITKDSLVSNNITNFNSSNHFEADEAKNYDLTVSPEIKLAIEDGRANLSKDLTPFTEVEFAGNATYENN